MDLCVSFSHASWVRLWCDKQWDSGDRGMRSQSNVWILHGLLRVASFWRALNNPDISKLTRPLARTPWQFSHHKQHQHLKNTMFIVYSHYSKRRQVQKILRIGLAMKYFVWLPNKLLWVKVIFQVLSISHHLWFLFMCICNAFFEGDQLSQWGQLNLADTCFDSTCCLAFPLFVEKNSQDRQYQTPFSFFTRYDSITGNIGILEYI